MNLGKSLSKVVGANVIALVAGLVNGFLIPKYLGITEFASLKTYTFYVSYIGFLHLGFIDGIYIKYGGFSWEDINKSVIKAEHKFFLICQTLLMIIPLIIGIVINNIIIIFFALSILPINVRGFYNFLYQATGEFDKYSRIKIYVPLAILILNLGVIFVIKQESYIPFIFVHILVYYVIFIVLEILFHPTFKKGKIKDHLDEIKEDYSVGFIIMISNFLSMFFYSLDRWFIKIFFSAENFAYYAFAISMMRILTILIRSITITFYPFLARSYSKKGIIKFKKYLLITASVASGGYFIFSFFVRTILEKYIPSLQIIAIIFAGVPAIAIINAIYINLYKVQKTEKKFFITVLINVFIALILNTIAYLIFNSIVAIAVATTVSFYIWFFYSSQQFKAINVKEILYLFLFLIIFFVSSLYLELLTGTIVFFLLIIMLIAIFYLKEAEELLSKSIKTLKR